MVHTPPPPPGTPPPPSRNIVYDHAVAGPQLAACRDIFLDEFCSRNTVSTTVRPVPIITPAPRRPSKVAAAAAWVGNRIQGVAYGVAFGHIGKFAMVAVYFILTQWLRGQYIGSWHAWNVKFVWDHLLSANVPQGGLHAWLSQTQWDNVRHTIRPFGEGLYGALLYQQILADPLRHLKRHASAGRIVATPVLVAITGAVVALPMFFIGLPLLHHFTHGTFAQVALQSHPALWQKLYTDSYDDVIVGILAGFAVRPVVRAALCTNMYHFCRIWRRVGLGSSLLMPAGMRHQVQAFRNQPREAESHAGGILAFAITFMSLLTATLAGYGFYILATVAR
jgi:hypothetical protein